MQKEEGLDKKTETHAICLVCHEDMGLYRPYYAEEHLKKYPTHLGSYFIDIEA
jgi:hypothetical protein